MMIKHSKTGWIMLLVVVLAASGLVSALTVTAGPAPTGNPAAAHAQAAPSGKIVFTGYKTAGIAVMNADGSGITNLTEGDKTQQFPSWSPDGQQIVFQSRGDNPREIYLMKADGSNVTKLTGGPQDQQPKFSPDGKKILFARGDYSFNFALYTMDPDGSNVTPVGSTPGSMADWSPDGSRIVYVNAAAGHFQIFVVNADGSNRKQITSNDQDNVDPVWSPDGSQIAYASGPASDQRQIYVMNADGSNPVNLSNNTYLDAEPTWSPDGQYLAYSSRHDKSSSFICVMHADGSDPHCLTSGYDIQPSWSGPKAAFAVPNPDKAVLDVTITYSGGFYTQTFHYAPDAPNIWHFVLVMPESETAKGDAGWVFTSLSLQPTGLTVRDDRQQYAWALPYVHEAPKAHFVGEFDPGTYAVAGAFIAGPIPPEQAGAEPGSLYPGVTGGGANSDYQTVTLQKGQTISITIALTDSNGWACPWLYIFDGQAFARRTEILRNVRGPQNEQTEITPLGPVTAVNGEIVIKVAEEKDEVTSIDRLALRIGGVIVPAGADPGLADQVAAVDGNRLTLRRGESAEFRFPVPAGYTPGDPVSVIVTGYYY